MKAGTDRREFRKVRPSKSRKGRCRRPWSEGNSEAHFQLHFPKQRLNLLDNGVPLSYSWKIFRCR